MPYPSRTRFLPLLISILFGFLCINNTLAQHPDEGGGSGGEYKLNIDWAERYEVKTTLDPYENNLLGDSIDPQTGQLTFETVDVSIPGNSGLEVAVRRRLDSNEFRYNEFSNWKLSVPVIRTKIIDRENKTWGKLRCSQPLKSAIPTFTIRNGTSFLYPEDYSGGVQMYIPGQGTQTVLDRLAVDTQRWPASAKKTTVNGWYLTCITNIDGLGTEGFLAHAPNGDTYRFDKKVIRARAAYQESWATNGAPVDPYDVAYTRHNVNLEMLAASRVTDVNGNWVDYNYDAHGRLLQIKSNDNRQIDFEYGEAPNGDGIDPYIDAAYLNKGTPAERKWTYTYSGETLSVYNRTLGGTNYKNQNFFVLDKVTLPDGQFWDYDLAGLSIKGISGTRFIPDNRPTRECAQPTQRLSVTHPYGMTGTFVLEEKSLTIAPLVPGGAGSCPGTLYGQGLERSSELMTVTSKTLSASNVPDMTWTYDYKHERAGSAASDTVTDVTRPDGTMQRYTHWNPFQYGSNKLGGKLKKLETFADFVSTTPLETMTYEYIAEQSAGGNFVVSASQSSKSRILESSVTTQREGDTYYSEKDYITDRLSLTYSYGNPVEARKWSNVSTEKRITTTAYEHNKTKWVIGLPKAVTQNGRLMSSYDYDGLGQLIKEKRYGIDFATYGYYADGTVQWVRDALQRKTEARDWKRGKPQRVVLANNTTSYPSDYHQIVDDNGWVTSTTDPKNNTTSYSHDSMGRVTLIDLPSSWDNTVISYNFSAPGAVQTITKGQSETVTTYDAMFRPILEQTLTLDTAWSSYVNTKYDEMGRVFFKSQPSTNANENKGMEFTYDELGRMYEERENVAPFAKTRHSYHSDHRYRVYDPSNAWTDYYSYGYDGPGNKDHREIHKYASDGTLLQKTTMAKNIYNQLTSVRQQGNVNGYAVDQTQSYYYDSQQRVCRRHVPETGATLYQYNNAGELVAYAKGQSNTGCGSVPDSIAKVSLIYDLLGRLETTDFFDSVTPDITRVYDLNDNVVELHRGSNSWYYSYNDINLLTDERLVLNDDSRSYELAYRYNNAGFLEQKTFPDATTVDYMLDGLGRSKTITQGINTLASNVNYHSSGSVSAMTYGNGQSFTQTLNARLLPERLLSTNGTQKAIDQSFSYDPRGKITAINDGAVISNNRSYAYDGMGRLTSATGPWGTGSYNYDALDNLRQKKLDDRTVDLSYDANNRLSQSADTGFSGTRNLGYDERGNVTSLGDLNFVYDYSDQPIEMSGAAAQQNREQKKAVIMMDGITIIFDLPNQPTTVNNSVNATYTYDGNLKRVKSVANGKTIYNIYDQSGALVHIDAVTDNQKTNYVSGPNGSLARISNNTITYLHPDHLGSAQSGTNESGNVIWREQYTPYGEEINSPAANDDLAGFTGHIKDSATGLNYMQARYYDPVIGRFLSNDPVGFVKGGERHFNRYSYTYGDPINLIDPTGKFGVSKSNLVKSAGEWLFAASKAIGFSAPLKNGAGPRANTPTDGVVRAASGFSTVSFAYLATTAGATSPAIVVVVVAGFAATGGYEIGAGINEIVETTTGASLSTRLLDGLIGSGLVVDPSEVSPQTMDSNSESGDVATRNNSSSEANSSNSGNNMSSEKIKICSGTGAQKSC